MLTVFTTVLTQMIGIVVILMIGYILNRKKILPETAAAPISKLSVILLLPALNLYTFMEECTPENFRIYWTYILVGGVCALVSVGMSLLISRHLAHGDKFLTSIYKYTLAIPNTGSVGTPLVLALYGTNGLFKYSLFLLGLSVITYTWGISLLIPNRKKQSLLSSIIGFFNPVFIALLIGCVLGLTGAKNYLPSVILETAQKLGSCYSPIVLLTTGFVIGGFGIKDMIKNKSSYGISALRLVILPLIFLAGAKLFHASNELTTMILFTFACSCGMNVVIYPASYGSDPRPGAQLFFVSTFLAIITVPLLSILI